MTEQAATIIITGGGGFLGQCLACELLKTKTAKYQSQDVSIAKIILADIAFPPTLAAAIEEATAIVEKVPGDVSSRSFCDSLYAKIDHAATTHVSVFHLGAVMSGDGERDFDLCMNVNLHGFLNMIEAARRNVHDKHGYAPKFLFASAGAIIGSGAATDYITKDDTICDATRATPHTTYGATKACCELLLSDYARRGFVNGRALRLPTIAVRAGKPNAATTSCFSAVVREPLAGVDVALPIAAHVLHAITSKRAAIAGMIMLHDATKEVVQDVLGYDRTVFLPAKALSLDDLHQALLKVVAPDSQDKLGKITYDVDQRLSDIVSSFPTKIDAARAHKIGIPPSPSAETIVREYMEDFSSAVVDDIASTDVSAATSALHSKEGLKVAVVTGGGSGIGRGVAQRLARGGWTIVLAGRRMNTLKETEVSLDGSDHLCVRTDVSVESEVRQLFDMVRSTYGRLDVLFNNAGINCPAASIEDITAKDFESVFQVNVTGPFLCAKHAIQLMKENGGGRIINNGSISAHVPRPGSAPYTAAKHAVLGLTKCIALDGRACNVACGQIDFGNVVSALSMATNKVGSGAMQANGTQMVEPTMSMEDAAETLWTMVNLPLTANVLQMTVMATQMPFVGRG